MNVDLIKKDVHTIVTKHIIPYTVYMCRIYLIARLLSSFPPSSPSSLLIFFSDLSLGRINCLSDAVLNLPLFQFSFDIIHDGFPDGSAHDPVNNTPGSKIAFRTTKQVHLCPACNPTQEEACRHYGVAAVGESFLNGDGGQVEEVSEHVEAKQHGRSVCWEEVVNQIDEWVVIMSREGVWCLERMIPGLVVVGCEVVS